MTWNRDYNRYVSGSYWKYYFVNRSKDSISAINQVNLYYALRLCIIWFWMIHTSSEASHCEWAAEFCVILGKLFESCSPSFWEPLWMRCVLLFTFWCIEQPVAFMLWQLALPSVVWTIFLVFGRPVCLDLETPCAVGVSCPPRDIRRFDVVTLWVLSQTKPTGFGICLPCASSETLHRTYHDCTGDQLIDWRCIDWLKIDC